MQIKFGGGETRFTSWHLKNPQLVSVSVSVVFFPMFFLSSLWYPFFLVKEGGLNLLVGNDGHCREPTTGGPRKDKKKHHVSFKTVDPWVTGMD